MIPAAAAHLNRLTSWFDSATMLRRDLRHAQRFPMMTASGILVPVGQHQDPGRRRALPYRGARLGAA